MSDQPQLLFYSQIYCLLAFRSYTFLLDLLRRPNKKNFSKQPPRRLEGNTSSGVAGHQYFISKVASTFFSDGVFIQGLLSSSETKRYPAISDGAGRLGGSGVCVMAGG